MNRRHFINRLAAAAFGFTILPPANTYDRVWIAKSNEIIVEYEVSYGVEMMNPMAQIKIMCDAGEPVVYPEFVTDQFGTTHRIKYEKKDNGLWARIDNVMQPS